MNGQLQGLKVRVIVWLTRSAWLRAPDILIWDNLNTHRSKAMRAFTGGHPDWLTVVQLPAYTPDLNPVEGAWSSMKSGLGNLSATSLDQLAAAVRRRLARIQRQPGLITGLLSQTRLTLESQPPWPPASTSTSSRSDNGPDR